MNSPTHPLLVGQEEGGSSADADTHRDVDGPAALLPCPFCGGEADRHAAMGESWVRCMTCGASTEMRGYDIYAASAWNRRHNPGWARRWRRAKLPRVPRVSRPDRRSIADRLGLSPTSGRVVFESGMSSGGFHETVFRVGRWVFCIAHDTKHWGGSRLYQFSIRREHQKDDSNV